MDLSARYRQLNDAQKQAVDTIDGPVMVVAGPGTGKTELLSVRIANILAKTDTLPENILCLTFTDSGAAAMRERLIGIIGKDAYKVAIHTFHSFGTEIINQNREFFYHGALFEPADELTRYEILRGIFKELPHDSAIGSTMNGEFTYLSDARTVISELKRNGLSSDELREVLDQNELALDAAERLLIPIFSERVGKTTFQKVSGVMAELRDIAAQAPTLYEVPPLASLIHDSLITMIDDATLLHPTKPVTAWKNKWLKKNKAGELCFVSREHIKKLRTLAYVYNEYLLRMERRGLYDFDDMIIQVVQALEHNDELRLNLQEKYLYLMVDEFQDTNLAQMRIIGQLTDNPVNEGEPNIMVVGDDDQAIFSFQGADISNILRFRELYPTAQLITLTDNYRSGELILNESRNVIQQGIERLERVIPELDKTLTPHQSGPGAAHIYQLDTTTNERQWLTASIKSLLKKGVDGQEIAVLARKHDELIQLLPYLQAAGIAVRYDRKDSVLDEAPVKALELLARVVIALADGEHDHANQLMPELLAHPAWKLTPAQLWRLSSDAYDARKRWMDVMETSPDFVSIHGWLLELAQAAHTESLEAMLDRMMGRPEKSEEEVELPLIHSPYFDYFFSQETLEQHPYDYLDYLTALRTIRRHLREYISDTNPTLHHFASFLALHRQLGTPLSMTRHIGEGDESAIHLMTAHKSKGLEFEYVFVINAVDSRWGEKSRDRARLIGYPENMPLISQGDTTDERLRLFYVAMTRAKLSLNISYSLEDDRARQTLVASFLSEVEAKPITNDDTVESLTASGELEWHTSFSQPTPELRDILSRRLADYKLSATHLNNFLNVADGGPRGFLLNNLLHFPSAKSAAAAFGSAIHNTLQQAHLHLATMGDFRPLEDVLHDFEVHLCRQRLTPEEFQHYLQKGSDCLTAYLEQKQSDFKPSQKAELNFNHQEVHLGEARLTGVLDMADIDHKAKTIVVADYKTGSAIKDGKTRSEYDKLKLYKYKQQLLFYKLLVEHSRDYGAYEVTRGELLFVEPMASGEIVSTVVEYDKEELERLQRLIDIVWQRIMALDLPDTSQYSADIKGVLAFEQDLLDGAI